MVNYPVATLPLSGFREVPPDYGDSEQEFVIPYSQSAPRVTVGRRKFTVRHDYLTADEVASLRAWWSNYANAGSFAFVHPRTGATVTCVAKDKPQIVEDGVATWRATVNFEERR